jgi:hypothetical protein
MAAVARAMVRISVSAKKELQLIPLSNRPSRTVLSKKSMDLPDAHLSAELKLSSPSNALINKPFEHAHHSPKL